MAKTKKEVYHFKISTQDKHDRAFAQSCHLVILIVQLFVVRHFIEN
jgi:hypothetical protein